MPWEQSGWCSTPGYAAAGGPGWPSRSSSASSGASCWPPWPRAGGRRTRSRGSWRRTGSTRIVYAIRPVPAVAHLPGVASATELDPPRRGESDLSSCAHQINANNFGVAVVSGRSPVALHARLWPAARPVETRPGAGIVHVATGRRRARRYRDPRPVRSALAGRRLQQPQYGVRRPARSAPRAAGGRDRSQRGRVPFRDHPRLPPVRRLGVRALGAPAHGGAVPVLRPPSPRCGRHPPVR